MNLFGVEDNEEIFNYFDIQNLSIDHHLSSEEIETYKDLIFSPNSISQIYFKDDCDLDTIYLIKNLITISEYCDDSKIEKYILIKLNTNNINTLLELVYDNPSTWNIPYESNEDNYCLTDIPKFRTLYSFIKKIRNDNYSELEQIMYVYDSIKMFDYDDNDEKDLLPDIVLKKKTNSYGMNKLLSYTLSTMGYKTFLGETIQNDKSSFVTLIEIDDNKYKTKGIFLFDPSMDTLPKDEYKHDIVRRINYNFFGIPLSYLNRLSYDEKPQSILSIMMIEDSDYSEEKLDNSKTRKVKQERKKLLKIFDSDYKSIHQKIKNTKEIDIDKIVEINDSIYENKPEKYSEILKENYISRKKELFIQDVDEEIEEYIKQESNRL